MPEQIKQKSVSLDDQSTFPERNPYPVLRIASDGRIIYANPASESFLSHWNCAVNDILPDEWRKILFPPVSQEDPVRSFDAAIGNRYFNFVSVWVDGAYINVYATDVTNRIKNITSLKKKSHIHQHALQKITDDLTHEIDARQRVENLYSQRQQSLEAVYAIVTAFDSSVQVIFDQAALSISQILQVEKVVIHSAVNNKIKIVSLYEDEHFLTPPPETVDCGFTVAVMEKKHSIQSNDREYDLSGEYAPCGYNNRYKTFGGIPILDNKINAIGAICVFDVESRVFTMHEMHIIEIFARYLGHEMTRRHLQKQLSQAKEMKLLGTLTSGVAHEVRNPLNGILAVMEALNQELGDAATYKPYLEHMRKQIYKLSDLMEDLLQIGRPVKEENLVRISVKKFIDDALADWRETGDIPDESIDLILSEVQEDIFIRCDPVRMNQVFINIFNNAFQHTPNRPVVLHVDFVRHNTSSIGIVVRDYGKGISSSKIEQIFEPFYTTRKRGTGLGMSIVKHVVENHGGRVLIENNTDTPGVSVSVFLPLELKKE